MKITMMIRGTLLGNGLYYKENHENVVMKSLIVVNVKKIFEF